MTNSSFDYLNFVDVPTFVLELDDAGTVRYAFANTVSCALADLKLSEIVGKTSRDIFGDGNAEKVTEKHQECFRSNKPIVYEVTVGSHALQKKFSTHLRPVPDETGKVIQVVGTAIDVTNDTPEREACNTSTSANAQMEQFVTLAAHDLRTPMRNVRILIEMLREGFNDQGDGKTELIDMLEEVAIKSGDLISEVLQHSLTAHADEGTSAFDIGTLCRDINSVLNPQAQHNLTWTDCTLETDKMVVQVVIRNLLDNALKHGGIEAMNIRVAVSAKDTETLLITVTDNGKGMDCSGIAFLETGTVRADSGYGLMGIRRLLTAQGGNISAKSGPEGVGTVIEFEVPGRMFSRSAQQISTQQTETAIQTE